MTKKGLLKEAGLASAYAAGYADHPDELRCPYQIGKEGAERESYWNGWNARDAEVALKKGSNRYAAAAGPTEAR